MRLNKKIKALSVALFTTLLISGCGGDATSSNSNTQDKTDPANNIVTESVGKGKALDAKVEDYDINTTLLGKTTTQEEKTSRERIKNIPTPSFGNTNGSKRYQ